MPEADATSEVDLRVVNEHSGSGIEPEAVEQTLVDGRLGFAGTDFAGDDSPVNEIKEVVGALDALERRPMQIRERIDPMPASRT